MKNLKFILPAACLVSGLLSAGCNGIGSGNSSTDSSAESSATQLRLEKAWETDTSLRAPESALWDTEEQLFFVSDINGDGSAKDGNGFISQLGSDGKIIKLHWVDGLDAPKGLALYQGTLYAADLDSLVVIDVASARITNKVYVPGATFLNDAVADPDGNIYVSDTRQGKVFKYHDGSVSLLWGLPEMKGANGLLWWKGKLWILTADGLYSYTAAPDVKPVLFSDAVKGGDGLTAVNDSDLIASRWIGEVYYIHANGTAEKLLDTRQVHQNAADLGYLPDQNLLTIPTFNGNTVAAYRLLP